MNLPNLKHEFDRDFPLFRISERLLMMLFTGAGISTN